MASVDKQDQSTPDSATTQQGGRVDKQGSDPASSPDSTAQTPWSVLSRFFAHHPKPKHEDDRTVPSLLSTKAEMSITGHKQDAGPSAPYSARTQQGIGGSQAGRIAKKTKPKGKSE